MGKANAQKPVFIEPGAPDVGPILHLHREKDGFVTFHRFGEDGRFASVAAIPTADLEGCFPGFVEELDRDAFYSVNSFYKAIESKAHPDHLMPLRNRKNLQWLTACYADLDLGREGMPTVGFAIGAIIDAQDKGTLPPASLFVRSGRGLWLFWMLKNDDPRYPASGPVRAWPETVDAYYQAQRAINERLVSLEADPFAVDVCRVTRVPGSMHTKAERRVAYWIQAGADGKGYAYTLSDLCARLGVQPRKLSPAIRGVVDPDLSEKRRSAFQARWANALQQFETLRSMRGAFIEGQRYHVCRLYACLLKTNGIPQDEMEAAVFQLAAECKPSPLEKTDTRDAFKAAQTLTNMSGQRIADWLGITIDESEQLTSWPPSVKNNPHVRDEPQPTTRKEKAEFRQRMLRRYIRLAKRVPTVREANEILAPFGLTASLRTIMNDFLAMGLENPRGRKPAAASHVQTELDV